MSEGVNAGLGDNLLLEVTETKAEARDVLLLELRAPDRSQLPEFTPGAHIELRFDNGLVRHYSLANDCRERDRYVLGIARPTPSRGGSDYVHRQLRCGMRIAARKPRNNFSLTNEAGAYVFVAGGIGITPIMSMCLWCEANGKPWRLVYAARNQHSAAFYEALRAYGERVHFHFDDVKKSVLDVADVLSRVGENAHIYCCGPSPLMEAVRECSRRLTSSQVHFEYFSPPSDPREGEQSEAFAVKLRKTGLTLEVPANKSILEVLEENGINVESGCQAGVCRTCEVGVCEGQIDHRDFVLSQDERDSGASMMICVSRALSPLLVLDL